MYNYALLQVSNAKAEEIQNQTRDMFKYALTHTHTHCSNYLALLHPCLPPSQCLLTLTSALAAAMAAVYPSPPRDSPPPPLKAMPTLASHLRQRSSRVELTRTRIRLSSETCRTHGWCRVSQPGDNRYQAFHNSRRQISILCHNQVQFRASQAQCLE